MYRTEICTAVCRSEYSVLLADPSIQKWLIPVYTTDPSVQTLPLPAYPSVQKVALLADPSGQKLPLLADPCVQKLPLLADPCAESITAG